MDPITCAKCRVPTTGHKCSRCLVTVYCSRECQRASWHEHKILCKKYRQAMATYADGMIKNKSFLTFVAALLKRFDAYGTNRGFVRCNVFRSEHDNEHYFTGKITYVPRPCESHEAGKNMIQFKYIAYGLGHTAYISFTNKECSDAYDAFVANGMRMSVIGSGQAVKFCCNSHEYFDVVAEGLGGKKRL